MSTDNFLSKPSKKIKNKELVKQFIGFKNF